MPYSAKLSQHLQHSKGLLLVEKGKFFALFWASYNTSSFSKNILKAFKATGLEPCDADTVLHGFRTSTPQQDEDTEMGEHSDGNSWKQARN
jgi:hypothetical protein